MNLVVIQWSFINHSNLTFAANGNNQTPSIEVQCPTYNQEITSPLGKPYDIAENDSECDSGTGPRFLYSY